MTLPANLQAVRDTGVAWCTEKQFAEILDLIETLAGALEGIREHSGEDEDGVLDEWTEAAAFDECKDISRAALDKYREFGEATSR